MKKESIQVALAYVGVLVGAGLSSGQDLLQYFLSFGFPGLIGVIALGVLNIIFGKILLTLGCYYQSKNHQEVLKKISSPIVNKIIDLTLIIASFVIGFVMVAGAGANLEQQFAIPAWAGSALCSILILLTAFLDFDKITKVLGIFTPVMIVLLTLIMIYTLWTRPLDMMYYHQHALHIQSALPNLWMSVLNYFSLCVITGVSMAFVLGGSLVRIGVAEKGGLLGGALVGLILLSASISLYFHIDVVSQSEIPMLMIVKQIHPWLATIYAFMIFGLIFNTAFSLYYSLAKRFFNHSVKKTRICLFIIVILGYLCSFVGFKELIGYMYPILGYVGFVLIASVLWAWIRHKEDVSVEKRRRRKIISLLHKKQDRKQYYSQKDKDLLMMLDQNSSVKQEDVLRYLKSAQMSE